MPIRSNDNATKVRARTDELQIEIVRNESKLRGGVATHRPEFLPPYQAALQAFDHTAAELLTSTRDNAEQQARIYRIIGLMDQWREEIANVEINEIQEGQNGEASTLIATRRGKQQIGRAAGRER